MGRLDQAVSPYLRSHAHQEVEWFPWGEEAFLEARRRNVPVMISIGYHTCHWCHVMSRECFDNPQIAKAINDSVVAIKVDREEHPAVDEAYMAQAQAFAENLGWPLTVFATPEGHAFYAATYLPPEPREGLPSLPQVLEAVTRAWTEKNDEVLESSTALVESLSHRTPKTSLSLPDPAQLSVVITALSDYEDTECGGFGGAPKFPNSSLLHFVQAEADGGNTDAAGLVERVLDAYARSDLRDSVEGGFFRYSTRRDFSEPHYERMLYDNAGLLSAYARAGKKEIAEGVVRFLRHQLFTGDAFGSAQDSESVIEGVRSEGGYYRLDAQARAKLDPPEVDRKIVTGWNGLALEGLALAHRIGCDGDPGELASQIATWLIEHHVDHGGALVRVSTEGKRSTAPATLEDYGGLALGLIELGLALGTSAFVETAKHLIDTVRSMDGHIAHDPVLERHGLVGSGSLSEGASPSGVTLVSRSCILLAALTGDYSYREFATALVLSHVPDAMLNPLGYGGILQVVSLLLRPSREVVVVEERPGELGASARSYTKSGVIVAVVNPSQAQEFVDAGFGLFAGRVGGDLPVAYVCEGGVCLMPVTTSEALMAQLTG